MTHWTEDKLPRQHLIGWGEEGPAIRAYPCDHCGAKAHEGHRVVVLGLMETLGLLKRNDITRIEVRPL